MIDDNFAKRNPPLASVCWVVAEDFSEIVTVDVSDVSI
jgi:hypothetical protein